MYIETKKKTDNVLLVAVSTHNIDTPESLKESLDELELLTKTADGSVKKKIWQIRDKIVPSHYVGKGKLEEIKNECELNDINLVIFDDEISPSQQHNLEKFLKIRVIDRTALILDIFAKHASSKTSKMQIELAQYYYQLPRLKNLWSHFSKQYGGVIGMRGPGETQLETDRRIIRKRIETLKEKLEYRETQYFEQRKSRFEYPNIVFIGYTNAGKSTLLNYMTDAGVLAEDKLFATLDSTSRKFFLPDSNAKIILTDTVGFIKKLPHQLIKSFKSTLDVTQYADALVHVVDISNPNYKNHIESVYKVLDELKVIDKPIITFFNKIDMQPDIITVHSAKIEYPNAVAGSAKTGKNIDLLLKKISSIIYSDYEILEFSVSMQNYNHIAKYFDRMEIINKEFDENSVFFKAKIPKQLKEKIISFCY